MTLSHKDKVFADVWDGDTVKAAKIAGLDPNYARKLVMNPNSPWIKKCALEVQKRIGERQGREERERIATRQDRQRFWTRTMGNKDVSMSDRLRASELLGKSEADFIDVVKGELLGKSEADFIDVVKGENVMRLQLGAPRAMLPAPVEQEAEFVTEQPMPIESTVELDGDSQPAITGQKQGVNDAQTGD
jgi:hypothetical protein